MQKYARMKRYYKYLLDTSEFLQNFEHLYEFVGWDEKEIVGYTHFLSVKSAERSIKHYPTFVFFYWSILMISSSLFTASIYRAIINAIN